MEIPAIGTLIDSYDQNKRFKISAYYTISFGTLASSARLELAIKQSSETVDEILKSMSLESMGFVPVFKNWITEDFQNAQQSDDYAFDYLFKSTSSRMIVHFTARDSYLTVDFLYDIERPDTERWMLDINHKLRSTFGTPKIPKFKVLIHHDGMFGTEDVSTHDFRSINISELYNNDFIKTDSTISEFMSKQESGIILLHGDPGTGKTSYIKHLICKFSDKEFMFVQNDLVRDLLKPTFVSFLLQNKNAILIIEDAEKVVVSRDSTLEDSVVSTILQLTDGLFSDFLNIKIICTFNTDIDRIDKALLRKGRMIANYHFKPLSPEKTAALAKSLGHENVTGSLTLADIFKFDKHDFQNASTKKIGFV